MTEKELERSIGEKYEKSMRKYISFKTVALICVLSSVLVSLMRLHGLSEEWAWRIAESLITIDGIVLGFVIVGVTFLSPERRFGTSLLTDALGKSLKDFLQELRVVEVSNRKKIQKKFVSSLLSGLAESFTVPSSIGYSILLLIFSIGCALSLFGVSDATTSNVVLEFVFASALGFSLIFLFMGLNMTYRFIQGYVFASFEEHLDRALEEVIETFSKDVESITGTKEEE